jgi:hypothetical protein
LGLLGRIGFEERGRFDPYVQVATGLGQLTRTAKLAGSSQQAKETSAVPLYAVSGGFTWQLSPALQLGSALSWQHWLAAEWERCPVLSGVCVAPPMATYDPRNGILSLSVSIGVSFGSRL